MSKLIAERAIRCGVVQKVSLLEGEKRGKRRNKVVRTHGFRKFVISTMETAEVPDWAIEKLVGHKGKGVTPRHYSRHEEQELLGLYLKAVDALTINQENRLRRENEMLKLRKSDYEYLKEQVEENKRSHLGLAELVAGLRKELGIAPDKNVVWDWTKRGGVSVYDEEEYNSKHKFKGPIRYYHKPD